MQKQLLFLLIAILTINCYSQITFEKGYFIDNTNQKTICLIKNIDWENNPNEFEYKLSEASETKKTNIKLIQEFGIDNISKYLRSNVKIDLSSNNLNKLSNKRSPIFQEKQLFLKVLIEGKANLYEYKDTNLKRYFYQNDEANIEQLIFKSYITDDGQIGQNNFFKQQLLNYLKCPNFKRSKFESLNYKKNDLIDIFVEYNECNNYKYSNFEENQKKDLFNLNIRPRLVNSSLFIDSYSDERDVDLGNKFGFGFGIEAEFILPFNRNKWAIIIEPTYQSLKTQKTVESNSFGGALTTIVDYNSIELPIGVRHYFFVNDKSKVFLNIAYVADFSFNSSSEYVRKDGRDLEPLEISSRGNFAIGTGYKYKDKYSLELRYQTSRDILSEYASASSDYKSLSIIIGYSFF